MAELDHNVPLTPYHYVANNPILNIDPDGLDWYKNNDTGEVVWYEGSDDRDGYTNVGAYHIIEGDNQYIIHYQNNVVAQVDKSEGYDEAYSRQVQHMTTEEVMEDFNPRLTEALFETGNLIQEATLTYAPVPKATRPTGLFSPAFKGISTVDDIIARATKGASTKGRATIYHRGGGYSQTLSDFNALKPSNVKTITTPRGNVVTGKLADGRTITARAFSSSPKGNPSTPTLEVQSSTSKRVIKFRY